MLSLCNEKNFEGCLKLIGLAHKQSQYKNYAYSGDKVSKILSEMVSDKENSVVFVMEDGGKPVGLLMASAIEVLFSEELMSSVVLWYVKPKFRKSGASLKLFEAFEYWSENVVKAKFNATAHQDNKLMGKLYNKLGYDKREETYMKRVG